MMTTSYFATWATKALPGWDVDLLIGLIGLRFPDDWEELVNWYGQRSSLRRNE